MEYHETMKEKNCLIFSHFVWNILEWIGKAIDKYINYEVSQEVKDSYFVLLF